MQSFTVVDIGVLVIVLVSAILAYSRGVTREIFAILGWVAAAALAFMFARPAAPMVKQIPVLDKFLGDNCELAIIAGFFAVFAVALILASIFTPLFSSFIQRSALSGVDQGLGFLFGVVRGVALVAIALVLYNRLLSDAAVPAIDNSRSAAVLASLEGKIADQIPSDAPGWLAGRYSALVGTCGGAAPGSAPSAEPAPDAAATGATATDSATGSSTAKPSTNTTGAKTVTVSP